MITKEQLRPGLQCTIRGIPGGVCQVIATMGDKVIILWDSGGIQAWTGIESFIDSASLHFDLGPIKPEPVKTYTFIEALEEPGIYQMIDDPLSKMSVEKNQIKFFWGGNEPLSGVMPCRFRATYRKVSE